MAACGKPEPTKVKDGEYTATDVKGADDGAAALLKAVTMTFKRGAQSASFGTAEGDLKISIEQTNQVRWPEGCGHLLELIDMKTPLSMKTLKVEKPVLIVGCPVESGKLILREAGDIDGDDPCKGATGACITWSAK